MKRLSWIFRIDPRQSQSTFEEGGNNVTGGDVMTEAEARGEGERGEGKTGGRGRGERERHREKEGEMLHC